MNSAMQRRRVSDAEARSFLWRCASGRGLPGSAEVPATAGLWLVASLLSCGFSFMPRPLDSVLLPLLFVPYALYRCFLAIAKTHLARSGRPSEQ